MVRVLIVAGDAVEAQELFYPYYRLREEGCEGVVAATSGNYGAAVASQAAKRGLKCIIIQEA